MPAWTIPYSKSGVLPIPRVGKKTGFFVINRKNPVFWFKPGFFGFYGFNGFYVFSVFVYFFEN